MAQENDSERDPGDEDDNGRTRVFSLPGFATRGPLLIGVAAEPLKAGAPVTVGADGKIMMFRVSPGESIHVETPFQRWDRLRPALPWWRRAWLWLRRLGRRPIHDSRLSPINLESFDSTARRLREESERPK